MSHLIDLFLFKGAPENKDENRECVILVNHGYVVGYSPARNQPLWSAYRVTVSSDTPRYDRDHLYYADERLDDSTRLDNRTFGTHNGVAYHVGHMAPNAAVSAQFGRLAQIETFFMSNMCPQRGSLNTGVWSKLEKAIRNIEDIDDDEDHMWAIVGPYFAASPGKIERGDGKEVDIPEGFFCVTVDPYRYPWDVPGHQHIACFLIPQDARRSSQPEDYLVSLDQVEEKTGLSLMPGWDAVVTQQARSAIAHQSDEHRLLKALEELRDT